MFVWAFEAIKSICFVQKVLVWVNYLELQSWFMQKEASQASFFWLFQP